MRRPSDMGFSHIPQAIGTLDFHNVSPPPPPPHRLLTRSLLVTGLRTRNIPTRDSEAIVSRLPMLDAFNIWDLFVGIAGLLTSIPIIWHYITQQLPSRKLRTLFKELAETDSLFTSCIEESLLKHHEARTFQSHLNSLCNRADILRLEAHTARSCGEDFTNLLSGLTRRINNLCKSVRLVRAKISTTSNREREERRRAEAAARAEGLGEAAPAEDRDGSSAPAISWWKPWTWNCGLCTLCSTGGDNDEDDDLADRLHESVLLKYARMG
ncbi:hypothetical protein OH77DRAFT_827830 [Trametes cingulata]|nr:hypothetical protein OH77DRAFT_827830 [Trametes cingulata]